jgi:hypothetical protein
MLVREEADSTLEPREDEKTSRVGRGEDYRKRFWAPFVTRADDFGFPFTART